MVFWCCCSCYYYYYDYYYYHFIVVIAVLYARLLELKDFERFWVFVKENRNNGKSISRSVFWGFFWLFFFNEERHKKNLPDPSTSVSRNEWMVYFFMVLYLYYKKFYPSLLWRHKAFTADNKLILVLKCCQSNFSPYKSCL